MPHLCLRYGRSAILASNGEGNDTNGKDSGGAADLLERLGNVCRERWRGRNGATRTLRDLHRCQRYGGCAQPRGGAGQGSGRQDTRRGNTGGSFGILAEGTTGRRGTNRK